MATKETPKYPKQINAELIYYVLDEIRGELREIKREYVTKTESLALKHQIEELREDFAEYKKSNTKEIDEIRKQKNLWAWLAPTLTAVVTAAFTYIVIEFLRSR